MVNLAPVVRRVDNNIHYPVDATIRFSDLCIGWRYPVAFITVNY